MAITELDHEPLQLALDIEPESPWGEFTALLIGLNGKVRSNRDVVFRKQRTSPEGEVGLENPFLLDIDLSRVPEDVDSIVVAVAIRPGVMAPEAAHMALRTERGVRTFVVPLPPYVSGAITTGAFRRWDGAWRFDPHAGLPFANVVEMAAAYGATFRRPAQNTGPLRTSEEIVQIRRQRLQEVQDRDPLLAESAAKAMAALEGSGHSDMQARIALELDISRSMDPLYRSGAIDELTRKLLGMAFQVDDDGRIDAFLFGQEAYDYGTISERNYREFVVEMRRDHRLEQNTMYGRAMERLIEHYQDTPSNVPVLALVVTDGDTTDRERTERILREASSMPIFWQFLAIGKKPVGLNDGRWLPEGFDFLERLDALPDRMVDNAAFLAVENPAELDETVLYNMMIEGYWTWLGEARAKGIVATPR